MLERETNVQHTVIIFQYSVKSTVVLVGSRNAVNVNNTALVSIIPLNLESKDRTTVLIELIVVGISVVGSILATNSLSLFLVLIPLKVGQSTGPCGLIISIIIVSIGSGGASDTEKSLYTVTVVITLLTELNDLLIPKAESEPLITCSIVELVNSYLKVYTLSKIYRLGSLEGNIGVRVRPNVIAFLINRNHCETFVCVLITGYGVHNVRITLKILRLDRINRPLAVCCRNGNNCCNESCNDHCRNKQH